MRGDLTPQTGTVHEACIDELRDGIAGIIEEGKSLAR
jgi:hypothetical protein